MIAPPLLHFSRELIESSLHYNLIGVTFPSDIIKRDLSEGTSTPSGTNSTQSALHNVRYNRKTKQLFCHLNFVINHPAVHHLETALMNNNIPLHYVLNQYLMDSLNIKGITKSGEVTPYQVFRHEIKNYEGESVSATLNKELKMILVIEGVDIPEKFEDYLKLQIQFISPIIANEGYIGNISTDLGPIKPLERAIVFGDEIADYQGFIDLFKENRYTITPNINIVNFENGLKEDIKNKVAIFTEELRRNLGLTHFNLTLTENPHEADFKIIVGNSIASGVTLVNEKTVNLTVTSEDRTFGQKTLSHELLHSIGLKHQYDTIMSIMNYDYSFETSTLQPIDWYFMKKLVEKKQMNWMKRITSPNKLKLINGEDPSTKKGSVSVRDLGNGLLNFKYKLIIERPIIEPPQKAQPVQSAPPEEPTINPYLQPQPNINIVPHIAVPHMVTVESELKSRDITLKKALKLTLLNTPPVFNGIGLNSEIDFIDFYVLPMIGKEFDFGVPFILEFNVKSSINSNMLNAYSYYNQKVSLHFISNIFSPTTLETTLDFEEATHPEVQKI